MSFSEQLKQAMQERNMTAADLCAATGIGKSSVSQYLSGKNEPTDKRKAVIAKALGHKADYFSDGQIRNLSVRTAARLMGKSEEFVYQGLKDGVFPWGYGVKRGSRWNFYISPVKFSEFTGVEVN